MDDSHPIGLGKFVDSMLLGSFSALIYLLMGGDVHNTKEHMPHNCEENGCNHSPIMGCTWYSRWSFDDIPLLVHICKVKMKTVCRQGQKIMPYSRLREKQVCISFGKKRTPSYSTYIIRTCKKHIKRPFYDSVPRR